MNNLELSNMNAKARHADMIRSADAHRRVKALKAGQTTPWTVFMNWVRGWRPGLSKREALPGSLETGKTV